MSYREDYKKWVDSLPAAERSKLARNGIDKPMDDGGVVHGPDVSEVPETEDLSTPDTIDGLTLSEVKEMMLAIVRGGKLPMVIEWLEKSELIERGNSKRTRVVEDLGIILDVVRAADKEHSLGQDAAARFVAECAAVAVNHTASGLTCQSIAARWNLPFEVVVGRVSQISGKFGVRFDEISYLTPSTDIVTALDMIIRARRGEVKLQAECVCIAKGFFIEDGASYSDIARRWGRSRQVVQTRAKAVCAAFGLDVTVCSKDPKTRETYRLRNYRHPKKAA